MTRISLRSLSSMGLRYVPTTATSRAFRSYAGLIRFLPHEQDHPLQVPTALSQPLTCTSLLGEGSTTSEF